MSFSVVCVLYTFLLSFYKCSSVITRNMIRMPQNLSHPPADSTFSGDYFLKPERLVSIPKDSEYKLIQPLRKEEQKALPNHFRPLDVNYKTDTENSFSKLNFTEFPLNSTSLSENLNKTKPRTYFVESHKDHPSKEQNFTVSPKELSSKYWVQYKNFSNEFFNKSNFVDFTEDINGSRIQRQYPQTNMLEILQNLFSCFWTSGLTSCLQDVFGNTTSENFPYFYYLTSRLPRFGFYDEDNGSQNDKLDLMVDDEQDEGRKRLSKKLQSILPFLLMLKMSMLPALAVMALVSGKAFLISLLSLGVALLTASMPSSLLSANKRHEVAPQSITSPDQLPSKYYYVM